jgi:hypothetical protein
LGLASSSTLVFFLLQAGMIASAGTISKRMKPLRNVSVIMSSSQKHLIYLQAGLQLLVFAAVICR